MKFEELNLAPQLLKAVQQLGYEELTPIQKNHPFNSTGKDIVGQSATGAIKTLARLTLPREINSRKGFADDGVNAHERIVCAECRDFRDFRKIPEH